MEEISRYHRYYKFPNGVTLLYYKHNVNNTTQMAVGFVGGSNKDGKIKGTAHFLEHMLCKETPTIKIEEINEFVRNNNIIMNAFTTTDYVVLFADTPNSKFNETCDLYRQLLTNRNFNKKSIDKERMAINQEILISKDEDQSLQDIVKLIQSNYKSDRILGSSRSIQKIDESVLQAYIDKNFISENMIVSVVSNLEFDEIKQIVEDKFVNCFESNKKLKNTPERAQYYSPTNIIIFNRLKNLKTIEFNITYLANQTEKEANLYSLLEDFVFNGFSGRLLKKLRLENGLVYSAGFEPIVLSNNLTLKCISALTSKANLNKFIDVMGKIIDDLVKNGLSEKDFQAFQEMVRSVEERRSGIKTLSPLILIDRFIDQREIFFNNQLHSVKDLTLEQVNDYLKKVFKKANIIIEILGDFDPKQIYSVAEIEKKLHARESKILFHNDSGFLLFPDSQKVINEEIPVEYLNKLEDEGKVGLVQGNYFDEIVCKTLLKLAKKELKKQNELSDDASDEENKDDDVVVIYDENKKE